MNFRDPRAISRSKLLKVSSDITFMIELAGPNPIFALKDMRSISSNACGP